MQVYSWLLEGHSDSKIKKLAKEQWTDLKPKGREKLIDAAVQFMKDDLSTYRERAIPDLMAKYLFLYERSMARDSLNADWLCKSVLDVLATFFHAQERVDSSEVKMSREALLDSVTKLSDEIGIDMLVQGKRLDD
jgi:hypothetical protein